MAVLLSYRLAVDNYRPAVDKSRGAYTRDVATRQRSPRRPAQRPDQILDAAERLLTSGPGELTMDGLAEAASLGKGTLYHYYPSKAEVLDALRRRYLQRSVDKATAVASSAPSGTVLRQLEHFIRALLDDAITNNALVWVLFHDTGTTGNAHLAIVSDALRDLIQHGVARGDLAIDNAEAVASFYAHGFFGRVQTAFHGPGVQPAELATELTAMLERLLTPAQPQRAPQRGGSSTAAPQR